MLIPSSFQRLPDKSGCFNGRILMGGTVSQMAGALAQLSHCKFLGEAHYQVGYRVVSSYGGAQRFILNKTNQTFNFLYQSTPLSERIAVIVRYQSSGDSGSFIELKLRDTASNSYNGTVLDYGIRLNNDVDITGNPVEVATAFTGTAHIDPPTNTQPDAARPLYVPPANRGQLINLQITTSLVSIQAVHIYDIYEAQVTP